MRANTTHLVQMEGSPSSRCGDANAGQSFVGDFVRICRSRTPGIDSRNSGVPFILLCRHRARISNEVLT